MRFFAVGLRENSMKGDRNFASSVFILAVSYGVFAAILTNVVKSNYDLHPRSNLNFKLHNAKLSAYIPH